MGLEIIFRTVESEILVSISTWAKPLSRRDIFAPIRFDMLKMESLN